MFIIEKTERDGVLLITLAGEFALEQIPDFLAHIEQAVSEGRRRILVDTGNVPFINSTAFGALIKARGKLRSEGGELALAALGGMPKETFEILQLDAMIRSYATADEGIEKLKWVDAAAVAIPEGEDPGVEFRFTGHDEIIVAGSGWQSAALQTLSERELQFLWCGPEGLDLFRIFSTETRLEVRPRLLPESEPDALTTAATVLNMIPAPEGAALVQVELTDLDEEFRSAVREFVRAQRAQ